MEDNYEDVVEEEEFEDDRDVPDINMVSEDGVVYDPNVNLDEVEMVDAEIDELEPFRIDDNMPQELKDQLIRFNKSSQNFYNIAVGNVEVADENDEETDSEDNDSSNDSPDSSLPSNDTIVENDIEVGNLF